VPFQVNSYTVSNGIDRQVVLYWYQQSGDRIVTNEYLGRVNLVVDSLTKNRSDAVLIRVSVPFEDDSDAAVQTGLEFIRSAYPVLSRFLPHDIATTRS
jgi:EpsI family protein